MVFQFLPRSTFSFTVDRPFEVCKASVEHGFTYTVEINNVWLRQSVAKKVRATVLSHNGDEWIVKLVSSMHEVQTVGTLARQDYAHTKVQLEMKPPKWSSASPRTMLILSTVYLYALASQYDNPDLSCFLWLMPIFFVYMWMQYPYWVKNKQVDFYQIIRGHFKKLENPGYLASGNNVHSVSQ